MKSVIGVTLRAKDGREQRTLVWLPTEETRREFFAKAERNGLEVIEHSWPSQAAKPSGTLTIEEL